MEIVKTINLALAFFLELTMLAAFGYWGFHLEKAAWLKWLLGLGVPLLAIIIWGVLLAPNSQHRLSMNPGLLFSLILFLAAAVALYQAGQLTWAAILAISAVINRLLLLVWKQW